MEKQAEEGEEELEAEGEHRDKVVPEGPPRDRARDGGAANIQGPEAHPGDQVLELAGK